MELLENTGKHRLWAAVVASLPPLQASQYDSEVVEGCLRVTERLEKEVGGCALELADVLLCKSKLNTPIFPNTHDNLFVSGPTPRKTTLGV